MGKIEGYTSGVFTDDARLLGTADAAANTTTNYTGTAINTYLLGKKVSVPASAGATGTFGDYAVGPGFLYTCVATDTWERVATATWV